MEQVDYPATDTSAVRVVFSVIRCFISLTVSFVYPPVFPELLQVRLLKVMPVPKSKLLEIFVAELLQDGFFS